MRLSIGLVLSILFHVSLLVYAIYWAGLQPVRVNMDRPVYTVDLVSLAPPPPGPAPVVEVAPEAAPETQVPVVEAAPEPVVEVKPAPVVEAKPEPKPEPKAEKISPKKVEKKTVVKKKEEPKPKPKPKPKKTAEQLRKEALAAAKATVKKQEQKKTKALQNELAALKKKEGAEVYQHGGQPGGVEGGTPGGTVGGTGSGLSEVYALIVGTAIKKHWRYPSFSGEANLIVTVEMVLDEEGQILSSKVIESSNNPEFDNSALRAIKETEYVERPRTNRDRVLRINFNSQELSE
ncbi:TonB family protein [Pseudodesulfovibrio sp.]|nr:TonB family protein [Pseudodesulfovibrio sp.]